MYTRQLLLVFGDFLLFFFYFSVTKLGYFAVVAVLFGFVCLETIPFDICLRSLYLGDNAFFFLSLLAYFGGFLLLFGYFIR